MGRIGPMNFPCCGWFPGAYDLVDTKDSTNVDTCIDVAATVQRIEDDTVFAAEALFDHDSLVQFFRDEDGRLPRGSKSIDHNIVREHIEFLLFFALNVCLASQAHSVREERP